MRRLHLALGIAFILVWWSGFLTASGLWMFDEILTLARYCGRDCLYPIPLLWAVSQYGAEGIGWVMILAGFGLIVLARYLESRKDIVP